MSVATVTTDALRSIAEASISEREHEGLDAPTVIEGGRVYSTYAALRGFVTSATHAQLETVVRAFNTADDADFARSERDERWAERDERRNRPMSERELAEVAEAEERARLAAEHARSVPGLLERLLESNEAILSELKKRNGSE